MSDRYSFSIHNLIKLIADPVLRSLEYFTNKYNTTVNSKHLELTGGVKGSVEILGDDVPEEIEMETIVTPDGHSHDQTQIPTSIQPDPSTIALRDSNAGVLSNGVTPNTGFLLANGKDISTLFAGVEDPYLNTEVKIESLGLVDREPNEPPLELVDNVVADAELKLDGNNLKLILYTTTYCSFWEYCRCQCCD